MITQPNQTGYFRKQEKKTVIPVVGPNEPIPKVRTNFPGALLKNSVMLLVVDKRGVMSSLILHKPIGKTCLGQETWVVSSSPEVQRLIARAKGPQDVFQELVTERVIHAVYMALAAAYEFPEITLGVATAKFATQTRAVKAKFLAFKQKQHDAKNRATGKSGKLKPKPVPKILGYVGLTIGEVIPNFLTSFLREGVKAIVKRLVPKGSYETMGDVMNIVPQREVPKLRGMSVDQIHANLGMILAGGGETMSPPPRAALADHFMNREGKLVKMEVEAQDAFLSKLRVDVKLNSYIDVLSESKELETKLRALFSAESLMKTAERLGKEFETLPEEIREFYEKEDSGTTFVDALALVVNCVKKRNFLPIKKRKKAQTKK